MNNDARIKILELINDSYKAMGDTKIFQHKIDAINIAIKALIENDSLFAEVERLEQENEQLREALKQCSPYYVGYCKFCLNDILNENHTADCEYIRLIGGDVE